MRDFVLTKNENKKLHKKTKEIIAKRRNSTVRNMLHELLIFNGALNLICKRRGLSMHNSVQAARDKEYWDEFNWRKQIFERAKKQKLILINGIDDDLEILWTEKGKVEALKQAILELDTEMANGARCAVIYDIPIYATKRRQELQKFLKRCGFTMVKQSHYETNLDCYNLMNELIQATKLGTWVKVTIVK